MGLIKASAGALLDTSDLAAIDVAATALAYTCYAAINR
jgi:hypothetical protein